MATQLPTIGQWYQDIAVNRLFEIIALDQYSATLEIQYEDGEIDELELDDWAQMTILQADPPEDWRNLFGLSDEQRLFSDDVLIVRSSGDPLAKIEPDAHYFGWDEF